MWDTKLFSQTNKKSFINSLKSFWVSFHYEQMFFDSSAKLLHSRKRENCNAIQAQITKKLF
jgi:hypothetical protein